MATAQMNTVIRHIRRAVLLQDGPSRTDGELLASFIDQKDEAAFEALLRRHGPMVFGVCRRVVGNNHDAEDAFQATFLVLARKAFAVRPRERVGNWLHGVAYRTALKARAVTAKWQVREKQVREMPELEAAQQDQWHDLQPLIDQELNGLPENYRLPILLCDLEGKTIKEATQQLGWPQGTLAGRLVRGRKMLAKRLANRGVVLSAGSLAAVVSQAAVSAAVRTSLMSTTVKAVTLVAAGQTAAGVISPKVAALMEGVLKTMLLSKLKVTITMSFVALAIATCGAVLLELTSAAAQQANSPAKADTTDQRLPQRIPDRKVQFLAFQHTEPAESISQQKALSSPPPIFAKIIDIQETGEVKISEVIPSSAIGEMLLADGMVRMPSSKQIKQVQYIVRVKEWQVFTAEGARIPEKKVSQLVKVGQMVLISVEDHLPDSAYLRLFAKDTLIFVAPKVVRREASSPKANGPTAPPVKANVPPSTP